MEKVIVFVLLFATFSLLSESFGDTTAQKPVTWFCPLNEEYSSCGRPCQTQCATLGKKCTIQNIKCPEGCYCKPGFARITPGGRCIPQNKCPRFAYPHNEVWLECGQASACQRWCDRPDIPCYIKTAKCPEGWYCKDGYSRHPKTNRCIKNEYCPKKLNGSTVSL